MCSRNIYPLSVKIGSLCCSNNSQPQWLKATKVYILPVIHFPHMAAEGSASLCPHPGTQQEKAVTGCVVSCQGQAKGNDAKMHRFLNFHLESIGQSLPYMALTKASPVL